MNRLSSNFVGVFLTIPSIIFNIENWILSANINFVLTVIISLLAIVWWVMKIYDQYLTTKIRKEKK